MYEAQYLLKMVKLLSHRGVRCHVTEVYAHSYIDHPSANFASQSLHPSISGPSKNQVKYLALQQLCFRGCSAIANLNTWFFVRVYELR